MVRRRPRPSFGGSGTCHRRSWREYAERIIDGNRPQTRRVGGLTGLLQYARGGETHERTFLLAALRRQRLHRTVDRRGGGAPGRSADPGRAGSATARRRGRAAGLPGPGVRPRRPGTPCRELAGRSGGAELRGAFLGDRRPDDRGVPCRGGPLPGHHRRDRRHHRRRRAARRGGPRRQRRDSGGRLRRRPERLPGGHAPPAAPRRHAAGTGLHRHRRDQSRHRANDARKPAAGRPRPDRRADHEGARWRGNRRRSRSAKARARP